MSDTHHSERWVSALCASTHPTIATVTSDYGLNGAQRLIDLNGLNVFQL